MQELVRDLFDLLERQALSVRRLVELGREEMNALRHDDLLALNEVVREQQNLGKQLRCLEEERTALQEKLARKLSATGSEATPAKLMTESLEPSQLAELKNRIKADYEELKELNRINRLLIQQTLSYVNGVLSAMRIQPTYGNGGRMQTVESHRMVYRIG